MASLLDKLEQAVINRIIPDPFTTNDLKTWIRNNNIINDQTGRAYEDSYIEGFLSSSTVGSTATKTDKRLRKMGTNPESYTF